MQVVKLSSKNQIVLPKKAREAMHLKPNAELLVVVKDNITIIIPKPESHRKALSGIAKGVYEKDHLKKERRSW
ncbi:MAG: AbrB/MazE/SpoVT family DNA-binding domain-containing protein [Deltaproteobacteria bacterium]|nr:AbrB/MazE/SpoVT family DNA-binding domain-containing protein [Deltaproteobacteria bacterium]